MYNARFQKALRTVSPDMFEWEIVAQTKDANEAFRLEEFYIALFDAVFTGYNEKPGDKYPWNKGKQMDEAYRKRMTGINNPRYGKTHSEEAKRKMSERMKTRQLGSDNVSARKVKCLETGKIWNSVVECAAEMRIKPDSIVANCGGRNKSAYGMHFEYCDGKMPKHKRNDVSGGKNPMAKEVMRVEDEKHWSSATECAQEIGVSPSMIHATCRGLRKSAKGYHFKYVIS